MTQHVNFLYFLYAYKRDPFLISPLYLTQDVWVTYVPLHISHTIVFQNVSQLKTDFITLVDVPYIQIHVQEH